MLALWFEEEGRLIYVVRPASKFDVGRRRRATGGVGLHVVILQEAAFRAPPVPPGIRAASIIAPPDLSFH
jgi:hypothetical protein